VCSGSSSSILYILTRTVLFKIFCKYTHPDLGRVQFYFFYYTRNVFAHNLEMEINAELKESAEYTHSFAIASLTRRS